jgi:hypothetical protein
MLRAASLRLCALSVLVFVLGIMFTMFLTYVVMGLVALTMFVMELINRGGYG